MRLFTAWLFTQLNVITRFSRSSTNICIISDFLAPTYPWRHRLVLFIFIFVRQLIQPSHNTSEALFILFCFVPLLIHFSQSTYNSRTTLRYLLVPREESLELLEVSLAVQVKLCFKNAVYVKLLNETYGKWNKLYLILQASLYFVTNLTHLLSLWLMTWLWQSNSL